MDHDLAEIEQYREDEHYRPDDADWAHEMSEPEPEDDEVVEMYPGQSEAMRAAAAGAWEEA